MHLKWVVIRYSPNAPDFAPYKARVLCRGSSGIAALATVLDVKNVDCHTPPAVCVRGGSTLGYLQMLSWSRGGQPLLSCGLGAIVEVCRSVLPLTLILYHKLWEKSICNIAQTFNQLIVQTLQMHISRVTRGRA